MTFTFREWHHGYLGLLLVLLGVWLHASWLTVLGAVVVLDDTVQHIVETTMHRPWRSPLHRLYAATLWRLPLVQRLNRWLDGLFR